MVKSRDTKDDELRRFRDVNKQIIKKNRGMISRMIKGRKSQANSNVGEHQYKQGSVRRGARMGFPQGRVRHQRAEQSHKKQGRRSPNSADRARRKTVEG